MDLITDQTEGNRMVLEWNNRRVSMNKSTSAFLAVSTLLWAAVVSFLSMHYIKSVVLSEKLTWWPVLFATLLLAFAYLVMYGLLATWVVRFSRERLILDENQYSHSFASLPLLFAKSGSTDQLTICFGTPSKELSPSLSVYLNGRRDIIAHGASEQFLGTIFEKIQRHVEASGIQTKVVDFR